MGCYNAIVAAISGYDVVLHDMDDVAAIEFLIDKLKDTKTNDEFFLSMKRK